MNLIKEWLKKRSSKNLRYGAISRQYLPQFHDKYMTKNKDFVELEENDRRIEKLTLEKQDGVPVMFYTGFKDGFDKNHGKHKGNPEFTVGGVTQGNLLRMVGGGYLGNLDDISEVMLVTDGFVYLKNLDNGGIIPYSHDEIETRRVSGGIV